ncbi:zeatin O-xylosyltransferase-like [Humulus lupulus]|uniref:zeatin O-xylosyltransferase-like n=1 Tax=Humulus lupulus TaxID=3486 RepID=UPI002B40A820|nr:zeatin O-xylosyltransferase-like [Humulus lupulus]
MATSHENPSPSSSSSSVVVVMVPYLAQSHLNQLLQFAHVVSSYNIPVHYVSSTPQISQVKSRALNPLHQLTKIHFHGYEIPTLPSLPQTTDPCSKTNNPEDEIRRNKASKHLREPVTALLRSLSPNARRLVVVYDVLMSWVVQDVVSLPNSECYSFHCVSVSFGLAASQKFNVPIGHFPSLESCYPAFLLDDIASQLKLSTSDFKAQSVHNSCRAIEGSSIELLANDQSKLNQKIWAVGPLQTTTDSKVLRDEDKCLLEWLDEQEAKSVLYISFGTVTTLSDEQIKEIALGLEQSGVKFIWALRDGDELDDLRNEKEGRRSSQVPDGFEERMRGMGMGMVVRTWVPQVKILEHPSTGGFMSHCGWNSCMESIAMGVPIATWPMQSDQPFNALLITRVLKVGVAVMEWEQRDELVTSSMISGAVRKIMASEEGDEIRKRAVEMAEAVKRSVEDGGDCRLEWDSFIAHITR